VKRIPVILLACLFLVSACRKKDKKEDEVPTEEPASTSGVIQCEPMPPPPTGFTWEDSITDGNKDVNTFMYNPVNSNEIIYVVNGDQAAYNKLFTYDVVNKQAVQIGIVGRYLPQINKKGLIVYSDVNNNVIMVRSDGKGEKLLTSGNTSHDPKWDYTGNYVYYFMEAHSNIGAQLVKIDTSGNYKDSGPMELPYTTTFKKSDKIIFIKTAGSIGKLILRDYTPPGKETELISGPLYSKPGQINFDNLTLDNNDENFFWSNSNGIFKCTIATLKIDTILKTCPLSIYNNPLISFKDNLLTYSNHILKPTKPNRLVHSFKAMEMNLLTRQSSEVRIFP
jgi:hypothetical protein